MHRYGFFLVVFRMLRVFVVVGFLLVKVQVPCVRENFSKVLGAVYCFVEVVHCRVPDLLSSRQMM